MCAAWCGPDAVRDFADKHGLALLSDYAELLADPKIQAIVLATPNSLHADQIVAAARAGKPVFCEKPLALTRADAERAVQACRQAGVALGVGQDKRFWPSMREMKRVVESGVSGVRVTPLYWRVHVFGTEGSAEALAIPSWCCTRAAPSRGGSASNRSMPSASSLKPSRMPSQAALRIRCRRRT